MTAVGPARSGTSDEAVAAGWFAGILTLALGGAGLIIAALAVGARRAWDNAAGESGQNRERRGSWLDNQRAWLDADHERRMARARAVHDWLTSGADPATKPAKAGTGEAWGARMRRFLAHTAVAGHDFTAGFKDGWKHAAQVRKDGGTFKDVAAARPTPQSETNTWNCPGCGRLLQAPRQDVTDVADLWCDGCRGRQFPDRTDDSLSPTCPTCGEPADKVHDGRCGSCASDPTDDRAAHREPDQHREPDRSPSINTSTATKGETMTQTITVAPAAESNVTVLRGMLDNIQTSLVRVTESTDALAAIRDQLHTQIERADEHATHTEQSAQSRQALDEARQVVVTLGKYLGDFSQASVGAEDQIGSASDGLRPVEQAEDGLRSVGAGGKAVAPATAA